MAVTMKAEFREAAMLPLRPQIGLLPIATVECSMNGAVRIHPPHGRSVIGRGKQNAFLPHGLDRIRVAIPRGEPHVGNG